MGTLYYRRMTLNAFELQSIKLLRNRNDLSSFVSFQMDLCFAKSGSYDQPNLYADFLDSSLFTIKIPYDPNHSCIVVVVLLFYVHGKHLRLCRDGQ